MSHKLNKDLLPTLASLRAAMYEVGRRKDDAPPRTPPPPFVTISRQAGAGGRSFATQLVARLNEIDTADLRWTVWDNELVERVAAQYHLRPAAVASLDDQPPNWLEEALGNLAAGSAGGRPDQLTLYHRVAATIRALAEIGRAVIVGRGAAFITKDLPGGVHLRLVAPVGHRVRATANAMNVPTHAAEEWVRQTDHAREAFYRRHWPDVPLSPENFTATLNTAAVHADRLVQCVLALIPTTQPDRLRQPQPAAFT